MGSTRLERENQRGHERRPAIPIIEQVDEPRAEVNTRLQPSLFDLDARGRQLQGWTNKLIWGDNKLILSSLNSGPMREEIERQGGIKLIYIDPPFDVGADFSMDIESGDDKKPSILEEIAYRGTWGNGEDSFIAMIYERLIPRPTAYESLMDEPVDGAEFGVRSDRLLRRVRARVALGHREVRVSQQHRHVDLPRP